MLHELRPLYFDVAVRAAGQVLDHVRRHAERAAYLDHLILPSLKELGCLVAAGKLFCLHAVGQDGSAERTIGAAVHPLPLLTQPLRRLGRDRVVTLQHDARSGPVAKVRGPVGLKGLSQTDGVLENLVGGDRPDAVFRGEPQGEDLILRVGRDLARRLFVLVPQPAILQPLRLHPRRVQGPQLRDRTSSTWPDLGVAGPVVQVHAGHPIAELLRRLPRIRLHVQEPVDRIGRGLGLAAIRQPLVDVQRQRRDSVRDHADAGRVGRAGHGVVGRDTDARRRAAAAIVMPFDATQVDHLEIGDGVLAHKTWMSQDCAGAGAVDVAWMPRAMIRATMPSIRSVLLALDGFLFP